MTAIFFPVGETNLIGKVNDGRYFTVRGNLSHF
jgi:hypothetical protein